MKRYWVCLFGCVALLGQDVSPGLVRGTLLQAEAGFVMIRQPAGTVVRCGFDSHTWIERDRRRLSMDALEPGTPIEALTDVRSGRCYTRTIRLSPPTSGSATRRNPLSSFRATLDSIYPRGNLTFGGVVLRRSPTLLVVRTRTEPEKVIRLRDDTRFLDSGSPASVSDVAVNTRVFIRAGKNFENEVEAYQVIWGEIAGPKTGTWQ